MDIGSGNGYPAGALSNFTLHMFTIDGVYCSSMEGFLQSLKFKNPDMQRFICTLSGRDAKSRGSKKNWRRTQTLWWQGKEIKRDSQEYQDLLDRAYLCMFEQSDSFRRALKASGRATLTHSIGKSDPAQTVLTVSEFCGRLTKLRERI